MASPCANNQRQPKGSVTIANYYQLSPTPLIHNCELLPIVTDPFVPPLIRINVTDPFDLLCLSPTPFIGIDLVIQAPKSPEFSYTVFYGIAWYYVVLRYIQIGEILTFFCGFWRFLMLYCY